MSKIWGLHFSRKKTAGGSLPRSTWVFCPAKSRMACMAWLLGKDQSWQNMVLVLIGLHMAPNGVLTGSLSRKFRGGSPDRHQIQPSCQKWIEIFRDLGRVGSGLCGFSGFFSELSELVPPGPEGIIWGSGGPWDYYLGVSWGKKGSPQFPLNC